MGTDESQVVSKEKRSILLPCIRCPPKAPWDMAPQSQNVAGRFPLLEVCAGLAKI